MMNDAGEPAGVQGAAVMLTLELYQVDAFTNRLFRGNAAAVVPLPAGVMLSDQQMLAIAQENNLSETAYVRELAPGCYQIRWFSPICEIDFCGHATLAAAKVLFDKTACQQLTFQTLKVGKLTVSQQGDWLLMDFPLRAAVAAKAPAALLKAFAEAPVAVLQSPQAWFVVYQDATQVVAAKPDLNLLKTLWPYDVVVTAPGIGFTDGYSANQYDFVSRYFWPANGGDEDPVTGSIHAGLTPYWAAQLGKTQLLAYQASSRGGVLRCQLQGERVQVAGQGQLYLQGTIRLPD